MPSLPAHSPSTKTYVIVGAGVFGTSTAYHLSAQYPTSKIILIDRDAYTAEQRVAASWDWNKVVRADYDDKHYCRLALEAQEIFRADPLWAPFYHETGIFWTCRDAYARSVLDTYHDLGKGEGISAVEPAEAREMFGGVFRDADFSDVREVLVNRGSGWAEAGACLGRITQECVSRGVEYIAADAEHLLFDGGKCTGVQLAGGRVVEGDTVIVATGAYTPRLLEVSAAKAKMPQLSVGRRIVAGGIATGMAVLDSQTLQTYKDMPVGVQGYTPTSGPFIGSLPPTKDGELKWWGQTIFSNTLEVLPGRFVSTPPQAPDYKQWEFSPRLKQDIEHARDVFYGDKSRGWKMDKHRICWDAFTTSADFIISPHSAAGGLYVATCGNFHGWKFFPVLGKYVVQMLEGALEPALRDKWAWDRARPDAAAHADYPRAELANLVERV